VIKFILLAGLFSFSSPATAQNHLSAIRENNSAVRKLEKEDVVGAERLLLQALPEAPFDPVLRLNLGYVYEVQKKPDRAFKEYEAVLRSPTLDDQLKYVAHFNAGNAAGQQQKKAEALKHYQAALALDPTAAEVKKNIEMLFKGGQGQGKGKKPDGEGKESNENQDQGKGDPQNEPNKPQDFKSQNLTKEDVRKIMEELKSQEKKIRALEHGSKGKEANPGKDW